MAALYREGLIRNIGVSNFNPEECAAAKATLEAEGVPLYGVRNHYSLLNRDWESCGLVQWCRENGLAFWAWAVLEEGILAGRGKKTNMGVLFGGKIKKLDPLFTLMEEVGAQYGLSVAQVAISYVASKGIVPVCGCRKPGQVQELYDASNTKLAQTDLERLEALTDELKVRIFGKDIFRFAVKKQRD